MLSELDFGTYIAFFLPGVLGLYALVPLSPRVAALFEQVVSKDSNVGASFLLLVAGLIVGTVVSGLRAVSLDLLIMWHKPKLNFGSITAKDTRVAYKEAVNNTYRFSQFYGNMFLALGFYLVVRYMLAGVAIQSESKLFFLNLIVLAGLLVQSAKSVRNAYKVMEQILGVVAPGLTVLTKSLPNGKIGQEYRYPLLASGTPPFTWTIDSGVIPDGLVLNACGGLSGAPSAKGAAQFILRVADGANAFQTKEPRGSGENRPSRVTSKPANGLAQDVILIYPAFS